MKSIESGSQDWIFFQVEADRRFGQCAMVLLEFENRQILQWNSPNLGRYRRHMRRIEVKIPPICRVNQTIQEIPLFIVKYTCSRKWPLIKITLWHMFIYIFVFSFVTVRLNLTESMQISVVTFSVDVATQKQISLPIIRVLTKDYLCRGSEFFIF